MKFSHYLDSQSRDIWRSQYIKYKELKRLLYEVLETGAPVVIPHSLSLSVDDPAEARRHAATPQERFFVELEAQVAIVNSFTLAQTKVLRGHLRELESRLRVLQKPTGIEHHPSYTQSGQLATNNSADFAPGALTAARRSNLGTLASEDGSHQQDSGQEPQPTAVGGKRKSTSTPGTPLSPGKQSRNSLQGQRSVTQVQELSPEARKAALSQLQSDTQAVAREYLALEKYVNLNFAALQKILKKHDKLVPTAPCWAFYRIHTANMPWVRGEHHDIQVTLRRIFTQLHSALRSMYSGNQTPSPTAGPSASQQQLPASPSAFHPYHQVQTTRKFWVRAEDLAEVEYHILQHLPVSGLPASNQGGQQQTIDDSQTKIVNMLYLDNPSLELYHNLLYGRPYATLIRLRWEGESLKPNSRVLVQRKAYPEGWRPDICVKDSFALEERRVSEFLAGKWTFADARKYMLHRGSVPATASLPILNRPQTEKPSTSKSSHTLAGGSRSQTPFDRVTGLTRRHVQHGHQNQATSEITPFLGSSEQAAVHQQLPQPGVAVLGHAPTAMAPRGEQDFNSLAAEMEAMQREYALFKTYTEVQRMVETKALQPVVRIRMHQTIFAEDDVDGAPAGPSLMSYGSGPFGDKRSLEDVAKVVRVQLDTNMRALLEYSYDGQARVSNGLWRQQHNTDYVDFPYACILVDIAGSDAALHSPDGTMPALLPMWLQTLIDNGKLLEVHDFSKFMFGCAGLLPDMVRAVPVWIDDPLVARCLAAQVLGAAMTDEAKGSLWRAFSRQATLKLQGNGNGNGNGQSASNALTTLDTIADMSEDAGGQAGERVMSRDLSMLQRTGSKLVHEIKGWQLKLLARQQSKGRVYAPQALFVESGQFLRNERIFLNWLTMCITLSGVGCAMLGFAASADRAPEELYALHVSEWTAIILLAVSIAMACYGLFVFWWRSTSLYELRPHRYDDTRGSLALNIVLVIALTGLFFMNTYDLIEHVTRDDDDGSGDDPGYAPDSPAAPPEPPAPLLETASRARALIGSGGMLLARCGGHRLAVGPVTTFVQQFGCGLLRIAETLRPLARVFSN